MDNEKVNLKDCIWEVISWYSEDFAEEMGIDKLDDEDINNILSEILSNDSLKHLIQEEVESYASLKK